MSFDTDQFVCFSNKGSAKWTLQIIGFILEQKFRESLSIFKLLPVLSPFLWHFYQSNCKLVSICTPVNI